MRKLNIYHRKDGRYEGRISKGKQKNGKRSFLYFFGKTKADVERKMALANEAVNCNEKCGLTIAEVFEKWYQTIRNRIKESTAANYHMKAKKHIFPNFGEIQITSLTATEVNEFVDAKLAEGLSARYIADIVILMKSIYKFAANTYHISNPMSEVSVPRTDDSKWLYSEIKKIEYLPNETSDFNEYVKMKHAFALYHYSLGEYKEALSIWQDLYKKKDELIAKDVCTVSRWMSDCMLRITEPRFSYDEIMEVLQYSLAFSSRNNYKRDILQSYFKIVSLMLDYRYHVNEDEFFSKLSATKEVGDESYTAFYYFLAYRILKLQGKDDISRIEKARVAIIEAEKHYRKIFDDAMCVRIAKIISNPDLDDINETENQKEMGLLLTQLY